MKCVVIAVVHLILAIQSCTGVSLPCAPEGLQCWDGATMTPTNVQCCGICNVNSPFESGYCGGGPASTTTCASEGTLCYDGDTADLTNVECCGSCDVTTNPYENGYCSGPASRTTSTTNTCASEGTLCYDGEHTADYTNVECCGSCDVTSNPYENVYCSGQTSTTTSTTNTCASEGTLCYDGEHTADYTNVE